MLSEQFTDQLPFTLLEQLMDLFLLTMTLLTGTTSCLLGHHCRHHHYPHRYHGDYETVVPESLKSPLRGLHCN